MYQASQQAAPAPLNFQHHISWHRGDANISLLGYVMPRSRPIAPSHRESGLELFLFLFPARSCAHPRSGSTIKHCIVSHVIKGEEVMGSSDRYSIRVLATTVAVPHPPPTQTQTRLHKGPSTHRIGPVQRLRQPGAGRGGRKQSARRRLTSRDRTRWVMGGLYHMLLRLCLLG